MAGKPDVIEQVVEAVGSAMPGWQFVVMPEPFTWAPERHFRAEVQKDRARRKVVIRRSWRHDGFQIESFLYASVLPEVPIRTPKLLATFEMASDGSAWMVLEDIGEQTADPTNAEHRKAFLEVLGRLHGWCIGRVAGEIDAGPLPRFPEWRYGNGRWRSTLKSALASGWEDLEAWVLPFLDRTLSGLCGMTPTLVHGDAHFSNVVLTDSGLGLVDWEFACIGPASLDIGEVLTSGAQSAELESYASAFAETAGKPLDEPRLRDWAALGAAHSSLHWVCYYLERMHEGRGLDDDWRRTHYAPSLERLRTLRRERPDLFGHAANAHG